MFSLASLPTTARRSGEFARLSKRLDEFYRRDFSSVGDMIKELFPGSWDRRLQRDVPIVAHYAKSLAVWYTRPPRRTWKAPDGAPLSDGLASSLARLYAGLRCDQTMASLNELLCVQHTVIGLVLPRPGSVDGVSLRLFSPFEVEVDPDAVSSTSIRDAREFRFRVPIDATHNAIRYGILRMNRSENYAAYEHGGEKTGVFNEDHTLPGGEYPVFVARLGAPPKAGDFYSSLPGELASAQMALSIAFSDADTVARFSSWGQRTLKNATRSQLESVRLGPDTILGLEPDQDLAILNSSTNLGEYMETIEQFLRHFSITNDLSPSRWLKGSLTGLSKAFDIWDRDASRRAMVNALRDAENSLYKAIRVVKNYQARAEVYPAGFVEVDHVEPPLPADALHEAQSRRLAFEDGLTTPAEVVAVERNIPLEEAQEIVRENVANYAGIRWSVTHRMTPQGAAAATFEAPDQLQPDDGR